MPGLDDAGVHRADRDLVQVLAFHRQERIGGRLGAVIQPGARVGQPHGFDPVQIAQRALQPDRRRMQRADRGITSVGTGDRQHADRRRRVRLQQRHVHLARLAPQARQRAVRRRRGVPPPAAMPPHRRPHAGRADAPRSRVLSPAGWQRSPWLSPAAPRRAGTRRPAARAGRTRPPAQAPDARTSARTTPSPAPPGQAAAPNATDDSRSISAPNAISRPNTNNTARTGARAKVELTMRNSLWNTPNGGSPAIAATPPTRPQPSTGWLSVSPPISAMRCVPFTCATWPTEKKIADLVRLCIVICNNPAKLPIGPAMPKANTMMPMCSIDE